MITESYGVSCYIEHDDNGQYHMECDMQTNDREVYSEYNGNDFVSGLNSIMDDIQAQMLAKPEPELKEKSLEEQVEYLEKLVNDLRDEKAELTNKINQLTINNQKNKKKADEDNLTEYFRKLFSNYYDDSLDYSKYL